MKTVYVATEEQKQYIRSLVEQFYTTIFPRYFTDEQIDQFVSFGVLAFEEKTYDGTLKDTFTIISALQSLQTIIELLPSEYVPPHYEQLFVRNVEQLARHGLSFPFMLEHFLRKKDEYVSMYTKPAHAWMM